MCNVWHGCGKTLSCPHGRVEGKSMDWLPPSLTSGHRQVLSTTLCVVVRSVPLPRLALLPARPNMSRIQNIYCTGIHPDIAVKKTFTPIKHTQTLIHARTHARKHTRPRTYARRDGLLEKNSNIYAYCCSVCFFVYYKPEQLIMCPSSDAQ